MIARIVESTIENPVKCWGAFAMDVGLAAFFVLVAFFNMAPSPVRLAAGGAAFVVGFSVWQFLEYVIHRWFFHVVLSPAHKSHQRHHAEPEELQAMPFVLNGMVLGLWLLLRVFFPVDLVSLFCVGLQIGVLCYGVLHHIEHHCAIHLLPTRRLRRSWAYHRIHHRLPNTNYGVTTSLWDRVFGTHYKPRKATATR